MRIKPQIKDTFHFRWKIINFFYLDTNQIHAAFAGDCFGQHRFPGTGHSVQQDTALELYRSVLENLRVRERPLENFHERTLGVCQATDVGPRMTVILIQLHTLQGHRCAIFQCTVHVFFRHDNRWFQFACRLE